MTGATSASGVFLETTNHATVVLGEGNTSLEVETGHPLRVLRLSGDAGLLHLPHDGVDRCTRVGTQASGWITTDLPWERMGGRGEIDTKEAWVDGRHPASMSIEVLGSDGVSSHASIGHVWAFHLSRLAYQFSSSIDGMEVAFSGGAVVTNHPEFKPYVVVPPSDRGGPGPRFAATVPSLHPTASSETGAGEMELDIEMVHRTSSPPRPLTKCGVDGPNRTEPPSPTMRASGWNRAKIGRFTRDASTCSPITSVGCPTRSYGTSEAVWHTNGEVIEFTLQLASLDVTTREVMI